MTTRNEWTDSSPTKAGVYWFRWLAAEASYPETVRVILHPRSGHAWVVGGSWGPMRACDMPGDWWPEPLRVPK